MKIPSIVTPLGVGEKAREVSAPLALVVILLLGITVHAHAEDEPLKDPDVQKAMRAMKDTSTWGHPDLFGEFAGMRYYAKHQYKDALKYLEIGAYYADKLSQLSIGLMYMNGEGVEKDSATALAWFNLAAERGYPNFVATRNGFKATLSAAELAKSEEIHKTLEARYGDAVAKPRMAVQLRQGQMQMTGSRLGFDSGVTQLNTGSPAANQIAIGGGTNIYAKNRWDPDAYFKTRDAEWKATVTVGEVESKVSAGDRPAIAPSGSAGPAEPARALKP